MFRTRAVLSSLDTVRALTTLSLVPAVNTVFIVVVSAGTMVAPAYLTDWVKLSCVDLAMLVSHHVDSSHVGRTLEADVASGDDVVTVLGDVGLLRGRIPNGENFCARGRQACRVVDENT